MGSIHHLKSSMLYDELHSLPLLKSLSVAYGRVKESSRVAAGGLTVLEYSCTTVLEKLYDGSRVAKGVDEMAGKGVAKLIDTYPALTQSPEELQEKTSSALKQSVRRAMKTPPGRALLYGLDWAIDRAEGLLKAIKPKKAARSPRKKLTRSAIGKQHLTSKDHAYALDDSGACDSDTRMLTPRGGDIPAAVARLAGSDQTIMDKVFRLTCILPLEVTVAGMKATRRYVGGKRKKTLKGGDLRSPTSRRKVSPKKKMPTSLLGKMKHRAFGLLGYADSSKKIHLEKLQGLDNPDDKAADDDDDEKQEKKRKHEEILTDSDTGDSADDIENFDFDAYDSGEDPDYQPTDESDSDSDLSDLSNADTESDVEVEPVGKSLVALKHGGKDAKVVAKDTKVNGKDTKEVKANGLDTKDAKANGIDGKVDGKDVVVNGKESSTEHNAKIEDFDIIVGDKGAKQDKGGQKNTKNDTPKPGVLDDLKQKVLATLSPGKATATSTPELAAKAPENKYGSSV